MRGQRAFFNRRLERTGKKVLTLLNYPCGLPLLSEDIVTTTYMPGRVQCQNPLGRFDEDIYISRLPMSRMTDVQRVQDRQRKVTYIPYPHKPTKSQGQRRRDGSSFAVREERRGIIRVLRGRLPVSVRARIALSVNVTKWSNKRSATGPTRWYLCIRRNMGNSWEVRPLEGLGR
ncbi:hypothetical protein BGY98DRAFT_348239 [Russula aff. rugulosa BPL654]|nr:hypothetical protein BGY98DRAFT_348239 [Russula aff. rugulosa BPL654]